MRPTVLCVDDEPSMLNAYRLFLGTHCAVETAPDAEAALTVLQERGPFPVVVSDLHMPGMDGIQFLAAVREHWPDTVRVLVTGHAQLQDAVNAVNDGRVFRFLTKPCLPTTFVATVKAAVAQYELIISDRRRFAEELRASHDRLAEQYELAALRAEVGLTLNQDAPLRHSLQKCCEAIHRHTGAAFVRVWTLNDTQQVLELQASAGHYTHIDGQHARIPVGQFKIGRIAASGSPHLTNSVQTDPQVGNPAWAASEGMVAFAGHPLIVADRVVGVLALFARQSLSDCVLDALKGTADAIALGVVRKRAEEGLRESEVRHRQLFDSNPYPMWVYDAQTLRFLAVNAAAVTHYGFSREQFLGMSVTDIEESPAYTSPTPHHGHLCRHRHVTGAVLQVEVASNPIEFAGRSAYLVLAVDVTERKVLEDQLKQAQKLESIGQLAAGIAHEINTPIQYIGDNTTFLSGAFRDVSRVLDLYRAAADPSRLAAADQEAEATDLAYLLDEAPRAIEQTLDGVKHVAGIVKAMKEFAHPGTDEKSPVDLNHAIQTVITVARNEWKYAAEVVTDLDPQLPPVPGLAGELNQVFLNLLVNAAHAIQATGTTGEKGAITISTRWSGNLVEVRVSDTGCGIPESIRGRIFDPFFTTKPVGQGTGQGLAIAHAVVVKRHGGAIAVESEVGRGTTFIVRLPIDGVNLTQTDRVKSVSSIRPLPATAGDTT